MKSKAGIGRIFSFIDEVRQEIYKITWPSRKEVVITTVIVFIFAIVSAIFFAIVDTAWYRIVHFVIDG